MCSNSKQYCELRERIASLEERYLPSIADPLGEYPQDVQDNARACILLVHAEIEWYLENMSSLLADRAVNDVANEAHSALSAALLFNTDPGKEKPDSALSAVKGAAGLHKKIVQGNNGLKSADVSKLFDPFFFGGMQPDTDLISELDSFGTKRGESAHIGAFGIVKEINAYETREQINKLVSLLGGFDCEIVARFRLDGSAGAGKQNGPGVVDTGACEAREVQE